MNVLYKNKDWLEKRYSNFGCSSIAKECLVSEKTIIYWLKKFSIKIRSRSESLRITKAKKGSVNEKYFEKIDSEEKAYWLGFLMADGCVREYRKGCFQTSFELSHKDVKVLKKFKKDVEFSGTILKNKTLIGGKRARIIINNSNFSYALINHGVIPNKTGRESIPPIKRTLLKDFIRGFFDGDGCIMVKFGVKRKIRAKVHFVGNSYSCLKQIKDFFIENNIQLSEKSLHLKTNSCQTYELETSSLINIMKIIELLYNNSHIYMERKYKKAIEFYNYYKTSKRCTKRYSPNFTET